MMNWNGVKITINKLENAVKRWACVKSTSPIRNRQNQARAGVGDNSTTLRDATDSTVNRGGGACIEANGVFRKEGGTYLGWFEGRNLCTRPSTRAPCAVCCGWECARRRPATSTAILCGRRGLHASTWLWGLCRHTATPTRGSSNATWLRIKVWKDVHIKLSSMHARVSLCCKNCNNNYTSTVHLFIPRQIKKTW